MTHRLLGTLLLACGAALGCTTTETNEEQPPVVTLPTYDYPLDDVLRLSHIQAKSTHNSYHIESEGSTLLDWAYTHAPLAEQLATQGVRHVELDVRLNQGLGYFEVYHLPVIDEETTCRLFTDCLAGIRSWSDTHAAHHPVVIQLELKDGFPGESNVEAYFATLEGEITSVWPVERIITPALTQGSSATLAQAGADRGWPTPGAGRAKVLFTMDSTDDLRHHYTHGEQSLDGRLIFVDSSPDEPFGAVAVLNDPIGSSQAIAEALSAGFLVRTRADSGGIEAAANDTTRLTAALESGAHFITTDFPAPVAGLDYWVDIPGGTPSRCNPVTAPDECSAEAVENPDYIANP